VQSVEIFVSKLYIDITLGAKIKAQSVCELKRVEQIGQGISIECNSKVLLQLVHSIPALSNSRSESTKHCHLCQTTK
jgi:hypothetical protein